METSRNTHRIARAVRVGLGGALIAGLSVIGVGLAAGTAVASASAPGVTVHAIILPVHCETCLNPQPLPP
jgi:hypothetical protein